jgi:hypothetical protein
MICGQIYCVPVLYKTFQALEYNSNGKFAGATMNKTGNCPDFY